SVRRWPTLTARRVPGGTRYRLPPPSPPTQTVPSGATATANRRGWPGPGSLAPPPSPGQWAPTHWLRAAAPPLVPPRLRARGRGGERRGEKKGPPPAGRLGLQAPALPLSGAPRPPPQQKKRGHRCLPLRPGPAPPPAPAHAWSPG